MRFAITVLCVGAVAFLLRVLLALVKEAVGWPREAVRADLAAFVVADPRRSLEEMKLTEEPKVSTESGKRMVFVPEVRGGLVVPLYRQEAKVNRHVPGDAR